MTMSEPMVKGGVLREFLEWYEAHHSAERVRRLVERVPEDLRAYIDPDEPIVKLLAASWYPSRLVHNILDTITEGLTSEEMEKIAYDSNRWIVKHAMGSVYRFALRTMATPELYALSIGRFWRQLHSTGERHVKVLSATSAESKVTRWPGHHPMLCTVTIETMCAIFEQMGFTDVHWNRTSCVSRGAKECVTMVTWKRT